MNEVQELVMWLKQLNLRDIRQGETLATTVVTVGAKKEPLRGVSISPDLVLGRDKKFYRIVGNHAVRIPFYLVCEQYSVREILDGYKRACLSQPRSQRKIREEP